MLRAADKWLIPWLRRCPEAVDKGQPLHVMICVCDHFEPFHATDHRGALGRMDEWNEKFTDLVDRFSGVDGKPPKQTFFYPIEQYDREVVSKLEQLCRSTGSEVEIHLHHDNDNAEKMNQALDEGMRQFREHGFLSLDPTGAVRFGFVHGNWALDNSDPEGKNCGVSRELELLRRAGCYGDFTMPSAPHPTQTRIVNSIYYAQQTDRPKSHDRGNLAGVGVTTGLRKELDTLLCVQGPLAPNLRQRKFGVLPRLENAELTGKNPPTLERFRLWMKQGIAVKGRPNWVVIKLHTHGALERNMPAFFGPAAERFHRELAETCSESVKIHYTTAREVVNIIHAAEDGHSGTPDEYRDYLYNKPTVIEGR